MLADFEQHLASELRDAEVKDPSRVDKLEVEHTEALKRWYEHSKQPAVQLGNMLRRMYLDKVRPDPKYGGEQFYEALTTMMKTPRAASELLNSAGVPGLSSRPIEQDSQI
jgi:hypothetical protein